jgi:hypothetical protein
VIANISTITANNYSVVADAYYDNWGQNVIIENAAGGIAISNGDDDLRLDAVAWGKSAGASPKSPPADCKEGTGYSFANGLPERNTLYRYIYADTGLYSIYYRGGGYDTNNNSNDFTSVSYIDWPDHHGMSQYIAGATPAAGAIVSCNDGISASTHAVSITAPCGKPNAYFDIIVPTGTWSIIISSNGYSATYNNVIVRDGMYTGIPNSLTSPAWPAASRNDVIFPDRNIYGYLVGYVKSGVTGINNIRVEAGTYFANSQTDGKFTIPVTEGSYYVTANPGCGSSGYIEYQLPSSYDVDPGVIVNVGNIDLPGGGAVEGKTFSPSGDPIDGVVLAASDGNVSHDGNAISDSNGYFKIQGLATSGGIGNYVITPQLDTAESASPEDKAITVMSGQTLFSATFTITNAFGRFVGSVYEGTELIKTGVLMMATTSTIADDPPVINESVRTSGSIYYGTASKGDGTFEILVRAGYSYNIYAWHTKIQGNGTVTTKKSKTNNTVSAGAITTVNFGPGTGSDGW